MANPREPLTPATGETGIASKTLRQHVDRAADVAADAIQSGADRVKAGADRAREGIHQATARVDSATTAAREKIGEIRGMTVSEFGEDLGRLVSRHPGKAVLASVFFGYCLGSLLSRGD